MEIKAQSAVIRAMRAYLDLEQGQVAEAADLSRRAVLDAERGRVLSPKTWDKLTSFYLRQGLEWRAGDPGLMVVTRQR